MERAQQEADKAINALAVLAPSEEKEALIALANIAVKRDH